MIIEQEGESVEAATELALKKLGLTKEKVQIEVLDSGKKGVFGLGSKNAVVRVASKEGAEQPAGIPKGKKERKVPALKGKDEEIPTEVLNFIKKVLAGIGLDSSLEQREQEDGTKVIEIVSSDSALLIGKKGKNLDALQHLANLALISGGTQPDKQQRIVLDAESYRERRREAILSSLVRVVKEVKETKKSISLEPMSSYERKIVHLALKEDSVVRTESHGRGEERHVVVAVQQ